jgi:hypothetical protein
MERIKLKPAKDELLVRDPVTKRHLKAEGEEKDLNNYWARRIMCGDVLVVPEKLAAEDPKAKKIFKN